MVFDFEGSWFAGPPMFDSYGEGPTIERMTRIDDRDHPCRFLTVLNARGIKIVPRSTAFVES